MSSACTPILVGVVSSVSEILLHSKTANFPSKNLINWIQAKKFMQVWIDDICMYTNFGGCGLLSFGDIATFKNGQFPLLTMDYSPWSSKKFNQLDSGQKVQASRD